MGLPRDSIIDAANAFVGIGLEENFRNPVGEDLYSGFHAGEIRYITASA
jgi:hypothetical protein